MIEARDLRIGNKVQNNQGKIETVTAVSKSKVSVNIGSYELKDVYPIPLTPDELVKLGFNDQGDCIRRKLTNSLEVCYMRFDQTLRLQTIESGFTDKLDISFVHEVQNLFNSHNIELTYTP